MYIWIIWKKVLFLHFGKFTYQRLIMWRWKGWLESTRQNIWACFPCFDTLVNAVKSRCTYDNNKIFDISQMIQYDLIVWIKFVNSYFLESYFANNINGSYRNMKYKMPSIRLLGDISHLTWICTKYKYLKYLNWI